MGEAPVAAALFRLEGALVGRPAMLAAAWLAANAQDVFERFPRLGGVALSASLGLADPTLALRAAWSSLRGTSEDRLVVLGETYAREHLIPNLLPAGRDLWAQAAHRRMRRVIFADHPEPIARVVAEHLGAEVLVANRLEVRNGRCTGRIMDPPASRLAGPALRRWAEEQGIDLLKSAAYGGAAEDAALLSTAGLPCAVAPDRGLRRLARDLDWPIVEA